MKKTAALFFLSVLVLSMFFVISVSAAPNQITIVTQPQDVAVNWTEAAQFTVVVDHPENVATYQWYYVDIAGQEFKLDGTSAKTNTLICPAVDRYYDGTYFYCELTDKIGNKVISDSAHITVKNYDEDLSVLFVSNYALKRGESLDLSGTELGSGVVRYSSDGEKITLDNVVFDNTSVIMDHTISEAVGLTLIDDYTDISGLTVELIGENTVKNTFYQPASNGSGITFDLYFTGKEKGNAPHVCVTGSGSLTLLGGTIQLRTNGALTLDAPVHFMRNGDYFCDAVNGFDVTVTEGTPLEFDVNGTVIFANRDINIESGASIEAKTNAPHVSGDYTLKNGFLCGRDVNIDNASVKLALTADPERFIPYELGIAGFIGINANGDVIINGSEVEITEDAKESNEIYFFYGGGISCDALEIKSSRVAVDIESNDIQSSEGIFASSDITVEDSELHCTDYTSGRVFGIATNQNLSVKNSTVTSECSSADDEAFGLMYKSADIDLNAEGQRVFSSSSNGFAMGANIGTGEEIRGFDEAYEPTALTLGKNTGFTKPADAVLNAASMNASYPGSYIYLETPYSLSDKTGSVLSAEISYIQPAAQIGDTTYRMLDEALAAAKPFGESVKLIKDIPDSADDIIIPENVFLDLNHHVFKTTGNIINNGCIVLHRENADIVEYLLINVPGAYAADEKIELPGKSGTDYVIPAGTFITSKTGTDPAYRELRFAVGEGALVWNKDVPAGIQLKVTYELALGGDILGAKSGGIMPAKVTATDFTLNGNIAIGANNGAGDAILFIESLHDEIFGDTVGKFNANGKNITLNKSGALIMSSDIAFDESVLVSGVSGWDICKQEDKTAGTVTYYIAHEHKLIAVSGRAATDKASGWKDYYKCDCGEYFEDKAGLVPIEDIEAWKAKGGRGYIDKLPPDNPYTGDSGNIALWQALILLSVLGICSVIAIKKEAEN